MELVSERCIVSLLERVVEDKPTYIYITKTFTYIKSKREEKNKGPNPSNALKNVHVYECMYP